MIRSYEKTDIDQIVLVWKRSTAQSHAFLPASFQEAEEMRVRNLFPQISDIWIKEIDREVVGFFAIRKSQLAAMFLKPELHGQGIGSEMMRRAIEIGGDLSLEVFQKNYSARRFYERFGFVKDGDFLHGPTNEILVHMSRAPMEASKCA